MQPDVQGRKKWFTPGIVPGTPNPYARREASGEQGCEGATKSTLRGFCADPANPTCRSSRNRSWIRK